MKYSEREVVPLYEENFTEPFMGTFGSDRNDIDVLTVVHHSLSYAAAEKDKNTFEILPGLFINLVPYEYLKEMKFRAHQDKDLWDIAQL